MRLVFLCYASEDQALAESIQLALASAGYEVFFDQESLFAGDDYNGRILEAIRKCDAFVFLATNSSVREGKYTLTELKFIRQRWPSPAGRVLAVNPHELEITRLPPYVAAATLLQTKGSIAAEVRAAVDIMLDRQRSVEQLSRQVDRSRRRKNSYAIAAAVGLLVSGVLGTVSYPQLRLLALGCQVDIGRIHNMWLREGQELRVADGWRCFLLKIDDVKVKTLDGQGPGELHVSFATEGAPPQRRIVAINAPKTVVVKDREYEVLVHDFSDVQKGADQAEVTLAIKE